MMLLLGISTSTFSQDFFINEDFKKALIKDGVDTDGDGYISKSEAHAVSTINVENEGLTDITGISEFKNIKTLKCAYNYLASLDVSANILLEELQCFKNNITSLNISANVKLTGLYCFENDLSSINISENTKLSDFQCYQNKLSTLDLSSNLELIKLECTDNQLHELDLSHNLQLNYLACGANLLTFLDVSYSTELTFLACSVNNFRTLDLSKCRKLEEMYATSIPHLNSICVWNISQAEGNVYFYKDSWVDWVTDCALAFNGNTFKDALTKQNIDTNGDGYIRLSEVAGVSILNISGNPFGKTNAQKITNIKGIDGFVNLTVLSMSYNSVVEMDVSKNTKLTSLSCDNNKLTSLDVSKNTSLTSLKCKNNSIATIYVWDIDYAESNTRFRKDASAVWGLHEVLKLNEDNLFQSIIYPIPSRNFIIIESTEDAEISIYNLLGVEVLNAVKVKKGYNRLSLNLKPDIYLLRLQGEKVSVLKRIIVE